VETGTDLADAVGWTGGPTILSTLAEVGTSTVVVFAALLFLYRFVPPVHLPFASLWPSAAAAAVAFELMAYGYVIYATRFAGFSTVYGPIGVVLGFLVLVYLLAAVILLGAETAAAPS